MSKVRVLLVEADGVDSGLIAQALQSFGLAPHTPPIAPPACEIPAQSADSHPAGMLSPAAESAARPEPKPQRKPKGGRKAGAASPASAAPAAPVQDPGCVSALLAALAKGPRTSVELIGITKFSSGSVYPALKKLREEGRVEMWDDPSDGQRKNRLRP